LEFRRVLFRSDAEPGPAHDDRAAACAARQSADEYAHADRAAEPAAEHEPVESERHGRAGRKQSVFKRHSATIGARRTTAGTVTSFSTPNLAAPTNRGCANGGRSESIDHRNFLK